MPLQLPARLALLTALLLTVLAVLGLEFDRRVDAAQARAAAWSRLEVDHARIAGGVADLFETVARRANELAAQLRDARPSADQIEAMLRARVLHDPTVGGVLVALEPNNYLRPAAFSMHASYTPRGFTVMDFYNSQEFTFHYLPTRRWYRQIIDQGLTFWSEAYFNDTSGGQDVVTRDAPLDLGEAGRGALNFDLTLDRIEAVSRTLGFERERDGRRSLLMDGAGRLVLHWTAALERVALVADPAAQAREPLLAWFAQSRGQAAAVRSEHETANAVELLLSTPIGQTGWRLGSVERIARDDRALLPRIGIPLLGVVLGSALVFVLVWRTEQPVSRFAEAVERFAAAPTAAAPRPERGRPELQRIADAFARATEYTRESRQREIAATAEAHRQRGRLELSSEVQHALLPDDRLFFGSQFELESVGRLLGASANDFHGCLTPAPGVCIFYMGSVAAEGALAALTMARLTCMLPAFARLGGAPNDLLQRLREHLSQDEHGLATTALLLGRIELAQGELQLAAAGANPPLLVGVDGQQRELELDVGPSLAGAAGSAEWTLWQGQLQPGDQLLLYSSGVVSAANGNAQSFGLDGLQIAVERHRESTPRVFVEGLIAELRQHLGGAPLRSDASVLLLALRHHD